jgi:hypothetical protein
MCGKPNPAEAEVCQHCQARLKPLNVSSAAPSGNEPEVPGWLTSLRGAGQDQPESAGQSEPGSDWLSGLRSDTSPEEGEEVGADQPDYSGVAADADRQVPDWLKGILPESETPSGPAAPSEVAPEPYQESEQDWFTKFHQAPSEPLPNEPVPLPDWLSSYDRPAETQPYPAVENEASQPPAEEIPSESPIDESASLPDWLSGFDQPTSTPPPASVEQPAAQDYAEETSSETPLPDWMSEEAAPLTPEWPTLQATPPEETPPAEAPSAEPLPQVEAEFTFPEEIPEEPEPDFADEEISFPDWLKGISQETNTPLIQGTEAQPPVVSQWPPASSEEILGTGQPESETGQPAELPDWLAAAEQSLQAEGDQSGLPEWLGQTGVPSQAAPSYTADETPSWLPPKVEPEELQPEAPSTGSVAPFEFTGIESETEMAPAESAAGARPDDTSATDLSWLDEMEAGLPGMALASDRAVPPDQPGSTSEPLTAGSAGAYPPASPLPAWLTQATTPGQPAATQETQEPDQSGLAPVELPSWLKSMQPTATMEGQTLEQAEKDQLEGSGPLIGLKGILPAEPDIVQATKPPVYSMKLRVTDLQQAHATMLAELVQAEGDVKALPSAPLFTSQGLQRVVIALVLVGVILFSMVTGVPQWSEPQLNPEVFTASQFIAGLPSSVPVLVAVDYAPGFSGDVSVLLASIVDHLATKNETVALVSTVPTGPLQVESLITRVKARPGLETIPINYANLGFVPGGASGILAFIQDPGRALPGPAWSTPGLQNIHSLADFAMLVVATENPETARMWIEQVRPVLPNIPIVMALSAQAEPLVRPYYNASPQQIQGLVGGYSAALLYDKALGRKTSSAALWSPFATGLAAAVLLMVIGLLVNLLLGSLARNREKTRSNEKA